MEMHPLIDIQLDRGTATNQLLRWDEPTQRWVVTLTPTGLTSIGVTGSGTFGSLITGSDIGVAGDTDLLQLAADSFTVNGDLTVNESEVIIKTPAGFHRGLRIGPANDSEGDGSYIQFTSKDTDGFGARIASGQGTFERGWLGFYTGGNNPAEAMHIHEASGDVGILRGSLDVADEIVCTGYLQIDDAVTNRDYLRISDGVSDDTAFAVRVNNAGWARLFLGTKDSSGNFAFKIRNEFPTIIQEVVRSGGTGAAFSMFDLFAENDFSKVNLGSFSAKASMDDASPPTLDYLYIGTENHNAFDDNIMRISDDGVEIFGDANITADLTVGGNTQLGDALGDTTTISGDLTVGEGLFIVDTDADRVQVTGDSASSPPTLRLTDTNLANVEPGDVFGSIEFYTDDTSGNAPLVNAYINAVSGGFVTQGERRTSLVFGVWAFDDVAATERMRISYTGLVTIPGQLNVGADLIVDRNTTLGNSAGDEIKMFGVTKIGDGGRVDYTQFSATGIRTFVGSAGALFGQMSIPGVDIEVTTGDANPHEVSHLGTGDGWAVGELNEVTFGASGFEHLLKATAIGRWKIIWQMSAHTDSGGGTSIHGGVRVNGAFLRDCGEGHTHVGNFNDDQQLSGVCVVDITSLAGGNDEISLWIQSDNNQDVHVEHGDMYIEQVGGT